MLITSEGREQPGTVEIIQIGNTTWMCSPEGGCIQTQQSAEDAAQTFGEEILFQPEDLLISSDYKYVGRDVVKGIRSRHYTVNPPYDMVNELAYGEVTVVQSDIWVADEPGMPAYVSRLRITWEGTRENKKVTGSWTYELYDVNKPITIQPPASAPAIPKDIPMCAGFTNQTVMGTTILLSCPDSVGTVAEFYRTEMARLGWTAGEESAMGAMVMQEWTKGDRKVSLMIAPGDQGGSSVMVTTE
ncbi:MAG: hypothetical protein D6793_09910 [Thermoflexia bacterium]|nr:MAG: hypothetical protein D6793_09910 [Thermoflexia bacterium]